MRLAIQELAQEQNQVLDVRYYAFQEDGVLIFYDIPKPIAIGDPLFPRPPQKVVLSPIQEGGSCVITLHADSIAVWGMWESTVEPLLTRVPGLTHITPMPKVQAEFRPIPNLTHRETEIAHLLSRGRTYQQIAKELVIEKATVGSHIDHIFDKVPKSELPAVEPRTRWRAKFLRDRGYGQ